LNGIIGKIFSNTIFVIYLLSLLLLVFHFESNYMMPLVDRGFSTFHALVAAVVSFYLVVISDLFHSNIIIDRNSWLSDAMFGVSCSFPALF
jgi:uncharacterized membrane protein YhaH (DUF805 family)